MSAALPGTSPSLYGIHEPCPPDVMPEGWILFLAEVGHGPDPHPGVDFGEWERQGYGILCRIQHAWDGGGTLPKPEHLMAYVERVRTLVQNSRFCHRWIIGNEPNLAVERPEGWPLTPEYVARCYNLCWTAIHDLPGHEFDEVLVPPIGPWNVDTGPWIEYFKRMIAACEFVDGMAIHAYTHGTDPGLIASEDKMDEPFQEEHYQFRVYRDWMGAIPAEHRHLPVYLTETDQNEAWLDEQNGWIPEMYCEIDAWNQTPGNQAIRCAVLYRWPDYDIYHIEGKGNVIADFQRAQSFGYEWGAEAPPEENEMLLNPSFEGAWYDQDPMGILVLPEHWRADYHEGNAPYKRPEIKPNQEFTTDGQYSIRAFPPAHSRGYFGIWQEVEVEAGQWYTFSADARIESKPPGEMAAFVGIQPWGAGIFERQMVWGKETQKIGEWIRVSVTAQAFGGRIRVVMGATNKWATTNNTVWWDNAHLEVWECDGGGTEPPVEPPPGGGEPVDYARIREIVREELDRTVWASGTV